MMDIDGILKSYLAGMNLNPPASADAISETENALNIILPCQYKHFLLQYNGGEGWVGRSYLVLDPIEVVKAANEDFHPGLLCIGSDGGGEAYCFDMRTQQTTVVKVPFVGSISDAIAYGNSCTEFLQRLIEA